MQVECRGNMFTMPRRRRFKPRKDCEAILGKLSSYFSLYHYIYILLKHLFEWSMNIYNPLQTPPFEKKGLCCKPVAYNTEGENVAIGGDISVS